MSSESAVSALAVEPGGGSSVAFQGRIVERLLVARDEVHRAAAQAGDEVGNDGWVRSSSHDHPLEILRAALALERRFIDVHGLQDDTGWTYSILMNRDADKLADIQWVARCAYRLRDQWPHADPTSLEEAAAELWIDESLRAMAPEQAAVAWLLRGLPKDSLLSK